MDDTKKTKQELIEELNLLREQLLDRTQYQTVQQALLESEARLQEAQQVAHIGYWEWNPGTNTVIWSEENFRIFGLPHDTVITLETFLNTLHPADLDRVKQAIEDSITKKTPYNITMRILRPDGRERTLHAQAKVEYDYAGIPIRMFGTIHDISDRAQAEAALRKSEEKYHDLFENAVDAIFLVDSELNYIDVNRRATELFGYSREEFLRMNIIDLIPQEQQPRSQNEFDKLKRYGNYEKFRGRMKTRTGELRDIEVSSSAIMDGDRYIGSRDIVRDISSHVRAETDLRESEEKFRTIFDQANDGILILNLSTGKFIEANNTICAMLGYSREEITNLGFRNIHAESDLTSVETVLELQIREEGGIAENIAVKRKDGTVFHADISSSRLRLGEQDCVAGVFRDISDRKQAEEAIKVTNTRLRTLIQAIPDMVIFKDTQGRHLIVNRAFEEMTGHRREAFIGRTAEDLLPPIEAAAFRSSDENVMRAGGRITAEEQVFEADGRKRYVEMVKAPIVDETGKVTGLVAIGRDITKRKLMEEALRNSERFIRTILDSVDEAFIVVDRQFRILTANKAYGAQSGLHSEAAVGKYCYEISHQSDRACHEKGEECAVRSVFATGEPCIVTHRHSDGKGGLAYVETKAFPIKDDSGTVQSVIETVNNITERHLLEEERLKTQKLEAIGSLAGGIAHDFNNLLQGVFGYISMAKMSLDQKERAHSMLEQAEQALHLSVSLTRQLLTFSRGGKPVKKEISLAPLIENSVRFTLSGSNAAYRIEIAEELMHVEADEGQLGQVIQNMVLNADQAMPVGGTILVTACNVRLPGNKPPHFLPEGRYVCITVQDSGVGMSKQVLPRIFDPYFSTKEKGSGLGLATSYSIIRNHGGYIEVNSEIDRGTTFTIWLQGIDREAQVQVQNAAVTRLSSTAKGRILVMDDDDLVRKITGEMITAAGHEADFAENGERAVEKYKAARDAGRPFDIVVLDLTVRGGMGGAAALALLLEIDPDVKALVSSGYSDDSSTADYRAMGFKAFLKKPYSLKELEETLTLFLK